MAARHASELELLRFDDEFEGDIRLNEPMARHTTYRIGGPAHAYAQVNSIAALATVLKVCADEELSWFVSGKGSNLLVSDEGYPGVVIALAGEFRAWQFDEEEGTVVVGAGTMLSRLVQEAFHHGFSGMEFAVGTPGTVRRRPGPERWYCSRLDWLARRFGYHVQCRTWPSSLFRF